MGDGVVRAGVGAHAALLTLVGIDVGPALAHGDGAELTGVLTGLSHTFAAEGDAAPRILKEAPPPGCALMVLTCKPAAFPANM